MKRRRTSQGYAIAGLLTAIFCLAQLKSAWAVVGQAEQYDEFKETELNEFQQNLTQEEQEHQMKMVEMKKDLKTAQGQKDEVVDQELSLLRQQLLQLPKRNRFKTEFNGKYQYDSNINRTVIGQGGNNDSLYDTDGTALFDLSGKKTDLRFEVQAGKHWDKEFPVQDFWTAEERIRYRRRYFKKLQQSSHSRIARVSSKTVEINGNKVRWDSNQQTSFNLPLTEKLSINTDLSSTIRYFSQEAFDQDSSWEATAAPSAFWNFTPKSRIALGYQLGTNQIHSKAGNTNTHEIHAGYFGRITRKSSVSFDTSFSHQIPKSRESASVNTWNVGTGYIWQMTGKTQLTLQAIRSIQNTTSDIISGDVGGENTTLRSDSHFVNDSISFSLNSRLTRVLTAGFNTSMAHASTKVFKNGDKDTQTTQFTFPFGLTLTYIIRRWASFTFGYTFTYRTGYEKSDRYRDHLISASARLTLF